MAREDAQFKHRFSSHTLREMIESAARTNKRSMTAEINARLEQSFLGAEPAPAPVEGGDETTLPALLSLDRKLSDLCRHLGVKAGN